MDNDRVIKLLFNRDESALAEIQNKCGNLLKSVALSIYRSDSVAEECLNDTLLDIWDKIPPEKPNSLMSYACTVIRRRAIDRVKHETAKKRAMPEVSGYEEIMDDISFVEDIETEIVDKIELTGIMNRFLGKLSAKNREIFMGRYFGYESLESIAARMNMTKKAVGVRIVRMKQDLKAILEKGGYSL